jgi:hypothetical protein
MCCQGEVLEMFGLSRGVGAQEQVHKMVCVLVQHGGIIMISAER